MTNNKLMKVLLNPLEFFEVDGPPGASKTDKANPEAILRFMCAPDTSSDVDSIISRYRQISTKNPGLFVAPYEQRILDKLIWPLRHAKASYIVGNYLGTIALCGTVAEMVAILLHDISDLKLNNHPMTEQDQINVFGRRFEKLGQERRVQILHAYGVVADEIQQAFEDIRMIRNKYLHLWSKDHDALPADAIASYNSAVMIAVSALGQKIRNGKLILKPALAKYLAKKGVFEEENDKPPCNNSGHTVAG